MKQLSASQLGTFDACRRKWAFHYIDGVEPGEPNVFAELGNRIHAVLAGWLSGGVAPKLDTEEGRIAAAGLKHLPVPSDDLFVESYLEVERAEWVSSECGHRGPGLARDIGREEICAHCDAVGDTCIAVCETSARYRGFSDLSFFDDKIRLPVVHDHKSTVDFKWAKSAEDLKGDVQASLYAMAAMDAFGTDEAELRWGYLRTRGKPASKLVRLRMTRDEAEKALIEADKIAAEVYAAYEAGKPAMETEYNARSCDMYGGCGYRQTCNLSTMDRIRSLMEKESLADKMRKRKEAAAAAAAKAGDTAPINPPEKDKAAKPPKPAKPATVHAGAGIVPPEAPVGDERSIILRALEASTSLALGLVELLKRL